LASAYPFLGHLEQKRYWQESHLTRHYRQGEANDLAILELAETSGQLAQPAGNFWRISLSPRD
jgi:hypothetical protein